MSHRRHCVVSLRKNINPSLVLVQSRKTRPFITERLLMGPKESNQTNKQNACMAGKMSKRSKANQTSNARPADQRFAQAEMSKCFQQ